LLVVLSILALLLTIASPRYFKNVDRAKEATLKQNLNAVREGIDKYYADKGEFPTNLEELVLKRYINKLPIDPFTESSDTWVIIAPEPPEEGDLFDLHSGASGNGEDGTPFSEW